MELVFGGIVCNFITNLDNGMDIPSKRLFITGIEAGKITCYVSSHCYHAVT